MWSELTWSRYAYCFDGQRAAGKLSPGTECRYSAEIDLAMAPVKSDAELQLLLAEPSPLEPLGQSLPAFINSLVFDEQGLVKLDRRLLQQPLSASEVYRILALFGWQSRMAEFDQAAQLSQTDSYC